MIYDSNNIIKLINEKREDGLHINTEDQLLACTKKNSDNKMALHGIFWIEREDWYLISLNSNLFF